MVYIGRNFRNEKKSPYLKDKNPLFGLCVFLKFGSI